MTWLGGTSAAAQTDTDAARAAFERGVAAYEAGAFEDALAAFQESYALVHDPQILFNVGTVADRLRRDSVALEAYEGYLAGIPGAPDRANVEARIAAIRASLAASTEEVPEERTEYVPPDPEPEDVPAPAPPPTGPSEGGVALSIAGGVLALAGAGLLIWTAVDLAAAESATTWDALRPIWERVPTVSAIGWLSVGLGVGLATLGVGWLVVGVGNDDDETAALRVGPGSISVEGTF